jgi:hypothetical protein
MLISSVAAGMAADIVAEAMSIDIVLDMPDIPDMVLDIPDMSMVVVVGSL